MLDCSEWTIYLWTCLVDGKKYVGQDKSGHRINDHITCVLGGCKDCSSLLHQAMRTYGIENFEHSVLECGFSSEREIDDIEDSYMEMYNTLNPNGYNQIRNADCHSRGDENNEHYDRILDHMPVKPKDEADDGFQIVRVRSGYRKNIPAWTTSNEGIQNVLLTAFPRLNESPTQRQRAGRWARIITLFYRLDWSESEIAEEMKLSVGVVKALTVNMKRVASGFTARGCARKRRTNDLSGMR